MANQLAAYNFPDAYSTLVNDFVGTVKYIATTGSNSNNGDSVTTPYLTINYAVSQTSATANVMYVILAGTYTETVTTVQTDASAVILDNGNKRVYVGCPGQTIVQWVANNGTRDCAMVHFTNTGSAAYGLILKRDNNGRTGNYPTAFFRSYAGALKGNFYNCVFREVNANNNWSYQYDNYGAANFSIRNCTFYNGAGAIGNYTNAGTCLTIDSVFNTTCTTGGTETNVLKSQTVNATTYATTGVTTAGVFSGTYAWNGAITPANYATVASTTGSPAINNVTYSGNSYTTYTFTNSGSITFSESGAIDYLIVAGGGGAAGGGAGAGGVLQGTIGVTGSSYNLTADSAYNSQGWVSGSTDYVGTTRAFSYNYGGIQSSSGGARTIALPEVDSYFEILISTTNTELLVGLARDTATGGYSNVPSMYLYNGTGYGGLTGGTTLGTYAVGDVIQIAYKASTNKFYVGRNNTWYISPTSGTGASIPGTGSLRLMLMSGASAGSNLAGTFRSSAQNSYSAPSGYAVLGASAVTVTVGAGGAGTMVAAGYLNGANGANSSLSGTPITTLTAIGGGGGGGYDGQSGSAGGSGGGAGQTSGNGGKQGGAATSGQGYAGGGITSTSSPYPGGGGGGAGGVGAAGGSGSTGGSGITSTITGSSVNYAGGGGGGTYLGGGTAGTASSGGGAGSSGGQGVAGTANTGGGGGGSGANYTGGAGGSGIVILAIKNTILIPGLYFSSNTVKSGSNTTATLVSSNVVSGNIAYTITGVSNNQLYTALTGNVAITSNSGTLILATKPYLSSNYTMMLTADGYSGNVTITPNVSISNTVSYISTGSNTNYFISPIDGQMNVNQSGILSTVYYNGSTKSLNPIDGQMNVIQSRVLVTDSTLSAQTQTVTTNSMLANTVVSYTTITNKLATGIDANIIKTFGDIPQREYWM